MSARPITRRRFLAASAALLANSTRYCTATPAAIDDRFIGAMLIIGFNGSSTSASGARTVAAHIRGGRVGGVCFLGHNMRSRAGVEAMTSLFHDSAAGQPLLVAVDQEGGAVQRLGKKLGYRSIRPAQAIAARNAPARAQVVYTHMAEEMRNAGFNLNLAPVVDLGFEPRNPTVAKWGRAFGKDADTVARYATAFVAAHRGAGVLTALKHFPGHGSTTTDSHDRPVDLTATWREEELIPFRSMVSSGDVDIIMSGHLSHDRLTAGEPATLSTLAIGGVLRREIGYDGVVLTDDLDMAAIRSRYPLQEAVIRAIAAGNDLILLSNSRTPDPLLPQRLIAAVRQAVLDGRLSVRQLEAAAERIARLRARV